MSRFDNGNDADVSYRTTRRWAREILSNDGLVLGPAGAELGGLDQPIGDEYEQGQRFEAEEPVFVEFRERQAHDRNNDHRRADALVGLS